MYLKPDGWSGDSTDTDYHFLGWLGIDGNNNVKVRDVNKVLIIQAVHLRNCRVLQKQN